MRGGWQPGGRGCPAAFGPGSGLGYPVIPAGVGERVMTRGIWPPMGAGVSRPMGGGWFRGSSEACEGIFFSNQKNIPSRSPRKIVRGDVKFPP